MQGVNSKGGEELVKMVQERIVRRQGKFFFPSPRLSFPMKAGGRHTGVSAGGWLRQLDRGGGAVL